MAGQTTVRLCADRTQAKRAGLDQASGLNASACQRSEGTKEAHQARDSMRSTTACLPGPSAAQAVTGSTATAASANSVQSLTARAP
jgi:hypothetical protein